MWRKLIVRVKPAGLIVLSDTSYLRDARSDPKLSSDQAWLQG